MNRIEMELVADGNPLLNMLDNVHRNLDRFMASADAVSHSLGSGVNRVLGAFTNFSRGGVQPRSWSSWVAG